MMKQFLFVFLVWVASFPLQAWADGGSVDFDKYFLDKTMRIDIYHTGDATTELVTLDRIYEQPKWAGSVTHLIDSGRLGSYAFKIFDADTGRPIYSYGFDSLFGEYRTTKEAVGGTKRTFEESALIPYPKKKIKFVMEARDKKNVLHPIFDAAIDPDDFEISREALDPEAEVIPLLENGDPHEKVDLVFVAEGYTKSEREKFRADAERLMGVFFGSEPYKSRKSDFNVSGVMKPSLESGCDMPSYGIYKNTAVGASFDSLGTPRYLMTEDNRSLRNVAGRVPYDCLFILVNTDRYGGGGIYNFYCTLIPDNYWTNYILIHEFGHSFAGLADEYYTSSVAYSDFFPKGQEPLPANVTALLDKKNLKWKDLVTPGIEIPTPWEKAEFDKMDLAYQKVRQELNAEIARKKREKAPEAEVKTLEDKAERLSRENAAVVESFLKKSKYYGMVGAFEGAGYASQGLYRPSVDCIMFTKGEKPYCKVCERAVSERIDYYAK